MLAETTPAAFVAFDLLADGAKDLRGKPFAARRKRLEELLGDAAAYAGAGAYPRFAARTPAG
jgi:ATP-dependent DNA ligase